jgi:glycosyltransferase involved in cell wall biosynthesis
VLFSIVIPTFNRVDLLKLALHSALNQADFDNFEVVVVDDCSDDGTWSYLQSVASPRLRIVRNELRLGMGLNWKKAIDSSRGQFIYLLQDDDCALPQLLSVSASLFNRYRNDLVCFATCLVDDAGQNPEMFWQPPREALVPAPQALLQFANHWTLSSSQVVFARALYDRHAGFDLTTPIFSDAEAILRWMVDADTVLYPDPLALRRRWKGSVSSKTQNSTAMAVTMQSLVNSVLRHAAVSRKLDDTEIASLEAALRRSFAIAPSASLMPLGIDRVVPQVCE